MAMNPQIVVECSDIVDFACDVVVLKYAREYFGAAEAVASRLAGDYNQSITPDVGNHLLLPAKGKIAAGQALFIGVPSVYQFDYGGIRKFASQAMRILAEDLPSAKHVAMTMQGVGYGLDEMECFLAQVAGLLDAFRGQSAPPFLQQVTIVERNQGRAERLRQLLKAHLPTASTAESIAVPYRGESARSPSRIEAAGAQSSTKSHIFIAMPFREDMEDTFIFGIQAPVNTAGYLCERVDLSIFTGDILAYIKSKIETASLVIADLTGANPNVYLEVGYAWGKGRPTLLIAKTSDELRFDVQGQRCLIYKSIHELAQKLEKDLAVLSQPAQASRQEGSLGFQRTYRGHR